MTIKQLRNYRALSAELKILTPGTDEYNQIASQCSAIKDYIKSIDKPFGRLVFRYKYIEPKPNNKTLYPPSWAWVAVQVHSSADYCKKIHSEILKKSR